MPPLDSPADDDNPLGARPEDDGPLGPRPNDVSPSIFGRAAQLFGSFTPLVGAATGLKEGAGDFGQGKLPEMDQETSDFLQKVGLLRPMADTWTKHVDAFNNELSWRSILRLPDQAITQIAKAGAQQVSSAAITAGFYGFEGAGALFSGGAGALGGAAGGVRALFENTPEAKQQAIQEGVKTGLGIAESLPFEAGLMHDIHVAGEARKAAPVEATVERAGEPPIAAPATEAAPTIPEAHDLGIIGDNPGAPQYSASGRSFIEEAREAAASAEAAPEIEPQAAPLDVHALARQIDPETFRTYDALQSRREAISDQLSILQDQARQRAEASAPSTDQGEALRQKAQDLTDSLDDIKNKAEQRRVRAQIRDVSGQADKLDADRQDFIDRVTHGSMISPDTQAIRDQMQRLDHQMRDLAEPVSAAYREAEARMPQESAPDPTQEPVAEQVSTAAEPQISAPEVQPEGPVEQSPEAAPTIRVVTTPEHLQFIADDVSKNLIAAGRAEEEANAAAQLVASHYEARAERFEGAKGTAQDLYEKDGPGITGAAETSVKVPEYAQTLKRGKIAFNDAKATITLFKDANASTFIHETGHHWLNEMMADAGDEQAPDGLKTDAQSVRDWLGTGEGEKITRAQHEKFARGFERYMMEGRAPSPGLAGVFEKFRNWLTSIYQTVSKLRSPITDDIRDVFDRLISKNPERQPVAGTPNAAKMLADIHEADAEATPLEHAAAARDQIKPELIDAASRAGENTREAVSVGSGRVEPSAGNAEASSSAVGEPGGAVGTGKGGAPTPSEVGGGAGKVGAEGGAAQPNPDPDLPPRTVAPEYSLENDPSLFKAGNLRLDKLTNDRSIDMAIYTMADEMSGFEDARRGIVPDSKVMELAEAAGIPLDQININSFGKMMLPEKVEAARRMLVESAKDLQTKAKAVNDATEGGSEAAGELKAFSDAWDRHSLIQRHLSSVSAEWGRIGRVLNRMVPGGEDAAAIKAIQAGGETPETYFQAQRLAKMIASTDTPGQVGRLISDAQKPTWQDFVTEYYIHNLISGPVTHTKYLIHNNLLMLARPVETLLASGIGKASELFNPDVERVHAGEAVASLQGYWNGLLPGINAAMRALKENALPALPGELSPDLMEAGQGFLPPKAGVIPGMAGEVFRVPARFVTGIHAFTRVVAYSQEAFAQAYRMAVNEGLEGNDLARHMANTMANPTPDFMEVARNEAMKQSLMEPAKYDSITAQLNRITNNNLALKLVQPFINVQANILKQSYLERTPIGIALSPEVRGRVLGAEGPVAQQMQIGKMILGGTIATGVGIAIGQGLATGGGPADSKERAIWLAAGNQPYSIRVGDTWISYRGGPIGTLMGSVADGIEIMARSGKEDAAELAKGIVAGIGKNILDESNLKGFHDAIDAALNPGTQGARYIRNMAANFIPWSVGMSQIARAFDPDQRRVETFGEALESHIPGASQNLTPSRDIFGNEIPQATALPGIYYSAQDNPLAKEMLSLGVFPAKLHKEIDGVDLDEKQYDDYQRISGRYFAYRLNAYVHLPGYSSIPPQMRANFIDQLLTDSRKSAKTAMKAQYPSIVTEAAQQKREDIKSKFSPAQSQATH